MDRTVVGRQHIGRKDHLIMSKMTARSFRLNVYLIDSKQYHGLRPAVSAPVT